MPLLTLADAQLAYGELPLLDRASFALDAGEPRPRMRAARLPIA